MVAELKRILFNSNLVIQYESLFSLFFSYDCRHEYGLLKPLILQMRLHISVQSDSYKHTLLKSQ